MTDTIQLRIQRTDDILQVQSESIGVSPLLNTENSTSNLMRMKEQKYQTYNLRSQAKEQPHTFRSWPEEVRKGPVLIQIASLLKLRKEEEQEEETPEPSRKEKRRSGRAREMSRMPAVRDQTEMRDKKRTKKKTPKKKTPKKKTPKKKTGTFHLKTPKKKDQNQEQMQLSQLPRGWRNHSRLSLSHTHTYTAADTFVGETS